MSAPFADIKFMPTGGISAKNLENYLIFDRIIACGGSWMVKDDLIKGRKFEEIRRLTEEAVQLVASIRRKASEEFMNRHNQCRSSIIIAILFRKKFMKTEYSTT